MTQSRPRPVAARGPGAVPRRSPAAPPAPPTARRQRHEAEVVLCYVCGDIMQRAGSCYACPSCGATSGCS